MIREKPISPASGWLMLPVLIAAEIATIAWIIRAIQSASPPFLIAALLVLVIVSICFAGLFVVNPNEARVVQLFGQYAGSVKASGFHWINPLTTRRRLSLRVRNFESAKLKVNDHDGNPIEIAAVVVWRVTDTAEALFEVDDYQNFLHVQSEAALRNLATSYPYDAHVEGKVSLRSHISEVATQLQREVQDRLAKAGIEVLEARISHLAYAPEIASAMLQRQQASAVVAARARIVEGAVGMVEMALAELTARGVVDLDSERKAAMVSNLLVVLCGNRDPHPVINAGTLYP